MQYVNSRYEPLISVINGYPTTCVEHIALSCRQKYENVRGFPLGQGAGGT